LALSIVWISPVNQNYEGPPTAYGDSYHGYWMADISKLNSHFGTPDDLKALSAELHKRDMYERFHFVRIFPSDPSVVRYLMVDVVVNNVMSTSLQPDYSKYFFKDPVSNFASLLRSSLFTAQTLVFLPPLLQDRP